MPYKLKSDQRRCERESYHRNKRKRMTTRRFEHERLVRLGKKKLCPRCKKRKLAKAFFPTARLCKTCHRYNCNQWNANNQMVRSSHARKSHLKRKYGIGIEDEQAMILRQKGRCLICRKKKKLCVDHCHKSGRIRGMICRNCNSGIGHLGDSARLLLRAADYIENKL